MNDIAKTNIKTKLEKALSHEVITNQQGAEFLGLNNPAYLSMIKNPNSWDKCPAAAWETVLTWVNSGQSLREYAKKHGKMLEPVPSVKENLIPEKPVISEKKEEVVEKKEEHKPKVKEEQKLSLCLAEIGWVFGLHKQGKTIEQISRKLNIYPKIVEALVINAVPQGMPEESVDPKSDVAGEVISKAVHEKTIVDIEINIRLNGEPVKIV